MKEKIQRFAGKISNQRHLLAVRDGLASSMPLILIGSIFLMIGNIPFTPYTDWLKSMGISEFINKAANSTFGLIGLGATFATTYHLSKYYKKDALSAGIIALASYVLVSPIVTADAGDAFLTQYFGSAGLFVGIIVALVTAELFRFFVDKNLQIRMPDSVPPNVAKSFAAFVPGLLTILFWLVVFILFTTLKVTDIHKLISNTMGVPLSYLTGNLFGIIVVILLQCFFWVFGIHGAQVTGPIIEPLLLQASDANRLAMQAGLEVPNIITYEFLYNFVFTGGAGSVFALALLVFFFSKSKQNKALGKLSIAPLCFQIAEPILFGLPTILNPKMVIPFVLAPVTSAIITYYGMAWGLVAKPAGIVIPWTTPPILAGFLATGGHISGALVSIVTIAVNALIYYPFFKRMDNETYEEELAIEAKEVLNKGGVIHNG
ncbi:PTS sugar transporter subunit IIC [Erysipelothrix sp. HDW6C]|uniref:PTS sugar transporter subunit IIC n=1 Tax=Erysipelothrix sp. HDW6C TaxID=2714930 RepID=UPI00140D0256|nr:PTS sugar transporter subunit IIC [Erysipelothrix sp. HDW6C]QIK70298.1 PTS sugar transporter subunit IIC [Erysipelothrix sp. HDW6C]